MKEIITKLKEIETNIELLIGKELTESDATDIYGITNDLMGDVKKLPSIKTEGRDLYVELRSIGLTSDQCCDVLDLIETLK